MIDLNQFAKDRNEALFSLDEKKIRAYATKYGIALPEDEKVFWAVVYKAVLGVRDAPEDIRAEAVAWLRQTGFPLPRWWQGLNRGDGNE